MEYRRHEDIPAKYRRIILDETLSKRVSKIPLTTCNEIIKEHLEEEEVMESLRDFEVIIVKNGKKVVMRSKDPGSALAELDKAYRISRKRYQRRRGIATSRAPY